VEAAAVLLFLLQALRVLFSVLFGLIYNVVFAQTMAVGTLGIIVVFVVAGFLMPLAAPLRRHRVHLLSTALVAALARIPMTINRPTVRLWSSILIIATTSMYAAALLQRHPRIFAAGFTLACAADQLLRAAGNTYDLSLRGWWLPWQVVICLAICAVAWLAFSRYRPAGEPPAEGGISIAGGLALGTLLFLESSLLGFPNALARWTGGDYAIVAPLLMAATLLPLMSSGSWRGLAILFATFLLGWLTGHGPYQLGILAPMLVAQLWFLSASSTLARPSPSGRPRLSLVLGMLLFLVLNVVLAFAFTYPYTVPFLRGGGKYVFLLATLFLLIITSGARSSGPRTLSRRAKTLGWAGAIVVVLMTTAFAQPAQFTDEGADPGPFRVGSYNIHYGYNTNWVFSLEQQASTIERSGADVVMLQEVDAGRITSYGVDDALWLGRRLGMQQVFGPALEELSGVALLSRFPITEADTQLLTSHLEQTAIVSAHVRISGRVVHAYGTWLGLEPEERARQLYDALAIIGDATPAVLGGDFNAKPGSATYKTLQTAGFRDSFAAGDLGTALTSPAVDPVERIDFVWTRGLDMRGAEVLDSLASDHRLVVVELALSPPAEP
ncbi:MAG: endonuclease/exonuclease/phosphatase family protein, partial [Anaerolineae bacterium]